MSQESLVAHEGGKLNTFSSDYSAASDSDRVSRAESDPFSDRKQVTDEKYGNEKHVVEVQDDNDKIEIQQPEKAHMSTTRTRKGPYDHNMDIEGQKSQQQPEYIFGNQPGLQEKLDKMLKHAEVKDKWLTLPKWLRIMLQISGYLLMLSIIYFVFVGWPLWHGVVYSFWFAYKRHLNLSGGVAIFIGVSFLFAVLPLTALFEKEADPDEKEREANAARAARTALVIPCHKSAEILPTTLADALKTFPPQNIFVIDNSRQPTPPDNTGEVCKQFGVRHIYVPVASKIAAQFIGVQAAYQFEYVIMIDDDISLPAYFPVASDRIQPGSKGGLVKCVGYTIRSVGRDGGPGTLCQQAQSMEYLRSGLMRVWLSKWASAVFPHGAISLWERTFLEEAFRRHPGFTISEDWFLGHVCRSMAGRIVMCSQVIVKTETPASVIFAGKGARAGYGEMTVTKQRMMRWNFFVVSRLWYNTYYILFRWRMGRYEIGTKLWVFRECYDTLLLLSFPWIVPIAFGVHPAFTIPITVAVIAMYYLITAFINEVQLRIRGVRVATKVIYLYQAPYAVWLRLCGVVSLYLAIFNYARYFTSRHPKVTENEEILRLMLVLSKKPYDSEFSAEADVHAAGVLDASVPHEETAGDDAERSMGAQRQLDSFV